MAPSSVVQVGVVSLPVFLSTLRREGAKRSTHSTQAQASVLRGLVRDGKIPSIQTPSAWAEALRAALTRPTR